MQGRREIAWVWDDEAARELNRRYLGPHAADDERLRRLLHEELDRLITLREAVRTAEQSISLAEDRAERVARELAEMDRELTESERERQLALEYVGEVDELLPRIASSIDEANAACG